ncbi:hypothetical protein EA462_06100 [Natrarchaeobius halalkaliphilus]|uniref:Uncharacterized protein n=1 Tax=Natrarchaeobius halalkaliphilus TaxID=1679091 RepID=A0A3N6P1V6_9EURY|nr:hypothetical protein EA462_06100 [Natrarchaeobius halalkaliphilus]
MKGRHDIIASEWDNLILLDACRFDMFQTASDIDGSISKTISKGSTTKEFLENTFSNAEYYDTVYVTSNPQYVNVGLNDVFHAVIDVWDWGISTNWKSKLCPSDDVSTWFV